jgi:hypothetical protein
VGGQWQLSDAWVFAAIEGSGVEDGYTLTQVIAKGDAINHAIITEEEFCRAVPRLAAAGLVGADLAADRYWHTDKGNELYQRCMKRRGLFGWIDAIPPALRRLGPPQDGPWDLPTGAFASGVRQWHRQAQQILVGLDRGRRGRRSVTAGGTAGRAPSPPNGA